MVRPLVPFILFPHGDNQFVGRLLPRIDIDQGITVCGKLLQNLRYFKVRGIRRFPQLHLDLRELLVVFALNKAENPTSYLLESD